MITNERVIIYKANGQIDVQPVADPLFATSNADYWIRCLIPLSGNRYAKASFTPSLNIQNPDLLAMDNAGETVVNGKVYIEYRFLIDSTILDYYDKSTGENLGFAPRLYYVNDDDFIGVSFTADNLTDEFPNAVNGNYVRVLTADSDFMFDGTNWVNMNEKVAVFMQDKPFESYFFPVVFANKSGNIKVTPTSEELILLALNQKVNKSDFQDLSAYVESLNENKLNRDGQQTMTGDLDMDGNKIKNVSTINDIILEEVKQDTDKNTQDIEDIEQKNIEQDDRLTNIEDVEIPRLDGRIDESEGRLDTVEGDIIDIEENKADKTYVNDAVNTHDQANDSHMDIRAMISALEGAMVFRGRIEETTETINNDKTLFTSYIDDNYSRTPLIGDTLKDLDGNEWYYDGDDWRFMGQGFIALASNLNDGLMSKEDYEKLSELYTRSGLDELFTEINEELDRLDLVKSDIALVQQMLQDLATKHGIESTRVEKSEGNYFFNNGDTIPFEDVTDFFRADAIVRNTGTGRGGSITFYPNIAEIGFYQKTQVRTNPARFAQLEKTNGEIAFTVVDDGGTIRTDTPCTVTIFGLKLKEITADKVIGANDWINVDNQDLSRVDKMEFAIINGKLAYKIEEGE